MNASDLPCPDNWQSCDHCGAGPGDECQNPDIEGGRHYPPLPGICANLAVGKPTNPKDAVGIRKVPMSTVPATVLAEVGAGMMEGARKYGRHNYRVAGIRSSVYYDATMRHLMQWWEGEDIDPDSGLSHIAKAISSLVVLRDAMIRGMVNDDRPPKTADGWLKELQPIIDDIFEKYPDEKPAFTELGKSS